MRRLFRCCAALSAAAIGFACGEPFWDALTRDPGQALLPAAGASVIDRQGLPYLPLDPAAASVSVEYGDLPEAFVRALCSAEDKRFFGHLGTDYRALVRAFVSGARRGFDFDQGGSTLTCQLVKNTYGRRGNGKLSNFQRKVFENVLAHRVEIHAWRRTGSREAAKEAIFAAYCNRTSFGGASMGLAEAVRYYFPGKSLPDLSLGECALLAGVVRGPGLNNPHVSPENARKARDRVLARMRAEGHVSDEEAGTFLVVRNPGRTKSRGDGFTLELVRSEVQALERDGLLPPGLAARDGAEVLLTLDLRFQDECARILRRELARIEALPGYGRGPDTLQGAVVVLEHSTGAALAVVGGRDHDRLQFNLAVSGRRDLASAIKPLVYAAYLDRFPGEPHRRLSNAPLERGEAAGLGGNHQPRETAALPRGTYHLVDGLAHSSNRMSLRAGTRVGWDRWQATAAALGLAGDDYPRSTDVWLGAYPASPWRAAAAFAALARRGDLPEPHLVAAVRQRDGSETRPLYAHRGRARTLFAPASCDLVHEGLSAVLTRGTAASPAARRLAETAGAAGKTGTSGAVADAWFVGYTDSLAIAVWIGYPEGRLPVLARGDGATLAFPVFEGIVAAAPSGLPGKVDWHR